MSISYIKSIVLIILIQTLVSGYLSLSYSCLEAFGVNCTSRDRCFGDEDNFSYTDRNCECDANCTAYKDCCIDALPNEETLTSRPAARNDVTCLHYGTDPHTGVYIVSKCNESWNGSRGIRQRCTSSDDDFSDPLSAAPVTDITQNETYRNLACAKCNNVNLNLLRTFQLRLKCPGLEDLPEAQLMANLTYDSQQQIWGAYKLNRFGNGTEFLGCNIMFDVPDYLNNSVRFCRFNLISTCVDDWTRSVVARQCEQYMAAVYTYEHGYRNPHCAICNHQTVDDLFCQKDSNGIGRSGFGGTQLIFDIFGAGSVGTRPIDSAACPSGEKYDPFLKRCRRLVCALSGRILVNGKCVKI